MAEDGKYRVRHEQANYEGNNGFAWIIG